MINSVAALASTEPPHQKEILKSMHCKCKSTRIRPNHQEGNTTRKSSLGVDFLQYGPQNKNRRRIVPIGRRFKFRRLRP